MQSKYREFPSKWATDPFTEYADQAFNNLVATFDNNKTEYPYIQQLDTFFKKILVNLTDSAGVVESILFFRTHAAFRAGCMLAMCGHAVECNAVLRSALENALYALHISQHLGYDELFLRRHDSKEKRKEVRKKFEWKSVMGSFKQSNPQAAKTVEVLYERMIDFGAHPNEKAVSSSTKINRLPDRIKIQHTYIAGGTLHQRHSLKTAVQVGLCGLIAFQHIFKEKFDILGISTELSRIIGETRLVTKREL